MQKPSLPFAIEPASPAQIARLIEIDLAASALFAPTGLLSEEALGDHVPSDILAEAIESDLVQVARLETGQIVGFTLCSLRGEGL